MSGVVSRPGIVVGVDDSSATSASGTPPTPRRPNSSTWMVSGQMERSSRGVAAERSDGDSSRSVMDPPCARPMAIRETLTNP